MPAIELILPCLALHFGDHTGWTSGIPGNVPSSGVVNWRASRQGSFSVSSMAGWLGLLQRSHPLFARVIVVEAEIEGTVPLLMAIERWCQEVTAELTFVSPATIKRIASGPFATRRDVVEWAIARFGSHPQSGNRVRCYEQAASLIAYQHVVEKILAEQKKDSR